MYVLTLYVIKLLYIIIIAVLVLGSTYYHSNTQIKNVGNLTLFILFLCHYMDTVKHAYNELPGKTIFVLL